MTPGDDHDQCSGCDHEYSKIDLLSAVDGDGDGHGRYGGGRWEDDDYDDEDKDDEDDEDDDEEEDNHTGVQPRVRRRNPPAPAAGRHRGCPRPAVLQHYWVVELRV